MGNLAIQTKSKGLTYRFVTDYQAEHYMSVKFLEHLCFSGSFDEETLTDCLSERTFRNYRPTSKVINYEEYQKNIAERSHCLLVVQTKDNKIFDGVHAYLYLWDSIIKDHYIAHIERYTHHSRVYQIDTGFFHQQFPVDKKW